MESSKHKRKPIIFDSDGMGEYGEYGASSVISNFLRAGREREK